MIFYELWNLPKTVENLPNSEYKMLANIGQFLSGNIEIFSPSNQKLFVYIIYRKAFINRIFVHKTMHTFKLVAGTEIIASEAERSEASSQGSFISCSGRWKISLKFLNRYN